MKLLRLFLTAANQKAEADIVLPIYLLTLATM